MTSRRQLLVATVVASVAALAAGCGSSKPAYCSHVDSLKNSVDSLSVSGGLSSLKTQLQKVESDAKSVVSSAKSDFPSETSAIDSSLAAVQNGVKAMTSSPSPQQLATVATSAKGLVDAVNSFASSTKSKCS
jgi:hypothetical protein